MDHGRKKAFILGIDGATFDIINPLIARGRLPNMQRVMDGGVHGILYSTIPSLSAPAWVAFMTGKNPGQYGTYHFRKINTASYRNIYGVDLINSSAFSKDTFFDYLGMIGYKVGVMTVPVTYPPWKVNGFLVSGYPCPDPDENSNFAFPSELSKELPENLNWTEKKNSTVIPKEELRGTSDPQDLLKGGLAMMSRRTAYTLKLMRQFDTDVTILVWGEIDRAQHILWKYHDPSHVLYEKNNPYRTYIEDHYCHADKLLGEILDRLDEETTLFIVSDHGAGPKQGQCFHLNAWLNQNGYLKQLIISRLLDNPLIHMPVMTPAKDLIRCLIANLSISQQQNVSTAKQNLSIGSLDFSRTRAYWFPVDEQLAGLVINREGILPAGIVTTEEYEPLRSELIAALSQLKDPRNGRAVIAKACRREELYSGSKVEQAPDILLVLAEGFSPGHRCSGEIISDIPRAILAANSGKHCQEGIFVAFGPCVSRGRLREEASIMDVAPSVLYALQERIPRDIEGKVLMSAFSSEWSARPPEFVDREAFQVTEELDLSEAEQRSMAGKLKDLGYL